MKISILERPALILIDIQKAFDEVAYWGGERNNPGAETNAKKLLDYWRQHNLPLFHIQHCSVNPEALLAEGNPGNSFKEIVQPEENEIIIKKSVNSAFIGTSLKEQLDNEGICSVVIAGLTTEHCVSTTTRMAGNYGFRTWVVSDATAAFSKVGAFGESYDAETMHRTALAQLNKEFATVIDTSKLLQEMQENNHISLSRTDLPKSVF